MHGRHGKKTTAAAFSLNAKALRLRYFSFVIAVKGDLLVAVSSCDLGVALLVESGCLLGNILRELGCGCYAL